MQVDFSYQAKVIHSIEPAASLFEQVKPKQPFLQLAFWQALEQQHALGAKTGWVISHILVEQAQQPVAWMPLFIKSHHRGEYIFDHSWADAYARHGLNYYPRLVSSVPFTPVTGERVLLAQGHELNQIWPVIFKEIQRLAEQLQASSWHGLFIDQTLLEFFQDHHNSQVNSGTQIETQSKHESHQQEAPLAIRQHCQFLWTNQNYSNFEEFLAALTAKKRKSIKVERQKLDEQQVECHRLEGIDITEADIEFFYQCYANTYHERGQQPYLRQAFFAQLVQSMPHNLMLIKASQHQQPVAAALFFKDDQTLYGRYWGALAQINCLHFEVCYYQGIDYAIEQNLAFFDPGTQGEHKLIRGFAPKYTYSAHWLAQPEFMRAVQSFCQQEKVHTEAYYQAALASTPFKQIDPRNKPIV